MSQYASARNRNPGWFSRTAAITVGQYSVSGAGPTRVPQVRVNTSFIINMAMSHRTPSHWSAMDPTVCTAASRRPGSMALSCTTSGHAGKYGSRPLANTRPPTATKDAGSAVRSASVPATKISGRSVVQGWSGATWLGTKSRISRMPRAASAARAGGATEVLVDDVAADAVRRSDDVLGSPVGQCCLERSPQLGVGQGD